MPAALLEIFPSHGREVLIEHGALIGRGRGCDVRLADPLVSRRHARLVGSELGVGIEDLGSRNGLFVNGRRRHGIAPLHPGDVVRLGDTVWLVLPDDAELNRAASARAAAPRTRA